MAVDTGVETLTTIQQNQALPRSFHFAEELGRTCSVAFTVLSNPDYRQSTPRYRMTDRVLRATHTARLVLRGIIPDYDELVGMGAEALVLRSGEGDVTVEKRIFANLDPEDQERDLRDRQSIYDEFVERFGGGLVVPTIFRMDKLTLRPAGTFDAICMEQSFLADMVDIRSAEALKRVKAARDTALEDDLRRLVTANETSLRDGFAVDTIGPNNVVISNDSGVDRILIPDVNTLSAKKLSCKNSGPGLKMTLIQRAADYEELLRTVA